MYITQTCYHDVELTMQEQCKWSVLGCSGVYITQTCYHDVELTEQEQCKWSVLGSTSHRHVIMMLS